MSADVSGASRVRGGGEALVLAGIDDTALVGRGAAPLRVLRNAIVREVERADRAGEDVARLLAERSLRQAAYEGDVENGKVEAGQSVGLLARLQPAAEVVRELVAQAERELCRAAALRCS